MKNVMDRLRDMREDHDISQSKIAAILKTTQQHYSKYETGECELPLRHFITLAEYYNVSADYLIGRCRYEEKKPLEMVYITSGCSCEKLLQDALSLSEQGRKSLVEYIEMLKLKEASKSKTP